MVHYSQRDGFNSSHFTRSSRVSTQPLPFVFVPCMCSSATYPHHLAWASAATLVMILQPDSGRVEWQLFTHADDESSNEFRVAWAPYNAYLGTSVQFNPRFYIYDGRAIGCGTRYNCFDQCINNDYYCSVDPDGINIGVSGAQVVIENLRQMCIWQQANQTYDSDYGQRWWTYASLFSQNCNTAATWTEACAQQQMAAAGINAGAVAQCMAASNATAVPNCKSDCTNTLLQAAVNMQADMNIIRLPTVVVNDVILQGTVSPAAVLAAICDGFGPAAPKVCSCQNVPLDQLASCVGPAPEPASSGMPGWGKALITIFVLGSVGIGGWVYYQRRKTRQEVEQALDDYRALMETGDAEPGAAGGPGRPPVAQPRAQAAAESRLGMLGKILQPPASSQQIAATQAPPSTGVM